MNEWLAGASRAQLALVMGLFCGIGGALGVVVIAGEGWAGALPAAIGAGLGGGLIGATLLHGQLRRRAEALGPLPAATRRAAERASLRGPVPEDPGTRAAAHALARTALAEHRRRRVVGIVSALFVLAMLVFLAVQASPWWWAGVAAAIGLLVHGWVVLPRRLERRAELLQPSSGGPDGGRDG
ncbi:hypothetical protein GCU60_08825 [Blastococcus saxobsidens]|uniref:Uncharacterized protein n=1 Tax=Blastococcus saxobsidens TaxID=138336 RepID=A0A6L9W358_9ACTN|nr:hypothetical protein [Blastococcus saxobsidens]NEK85864.1 hypothetical protein [Blastococcus saxobsidens]